MHERGINMRYLGIILAQLDYGVGAWHTTLLEVLSRAAKVHLRQTMRDTDSAYLGEAMSHFLNCLIGSATSPIGRKKGKGKEKRHHFSSTLTSSRLWAAIATTCQTNFFCVISERVLKSAVSYQHNLLHAHTHTSDDPRCFHVLVLLPFFRNDL
jgi:protein TIF31